MTDWRHPGYQMVIPWMCATPTAEAIDWYHDVLGATERTRIEMGGRIIHSEQMIGDNVIIVSDEIPDMGILSPKTTGGSPVTVWVQVPDSDAVYQKALDAGATASLPLTDMPYGDRSGAFACPFGHHWYVATHIEDVAPEEIQRRMAAHG
ncbi:VOC family protein [Nocardia wallacei]|uniref:VOC family protein n=1 Tax=Nocardia wallacei TaxID=480035 RepID=UPI0024555CA0|nr:VOC family protein [Nocardia wallacei]